MVRRHIGFGRIRAFSGRGTERGGGGGSPNDNGGNVCTYYVRPLCFLSNVAFELFAVQAPEALIALVLRQVPTADSLCICANVGCTTPMSEAMMGDKDVYRSVFSMSRFSP